MQVVSIICNSETPYGLCKTGEFLTLHPECEGNLDAPHWIPAGGCHPNEFVSNRDGTTQIIRGSSQNVCVRGY